jgi:hypothetical protein
VSRKGRANQTARGMGGRKTCLTIGNGKPSVLLFDLKVTKTLAVCTLLVSVHMFLLFARLSTLFDILLFGWGVGHDVGFRVHAECFWLRWARLRPRQTG